MFKSILPALSILIAFISLALPAQAAEGQTIQCENHRFKIVGELNTKKMILEVSDDESYVTDKAEDFEFEASEDYKSEFPSGSSFEAWTPDYFLVLNLPKRVFKSNIRSEFEAKFLTLFEGFRVSYKGSLTCIALD